MLYKYEATTLEGEKQNGNIDAPNIDIAINSLQRRNLIIVSIVPAEKSGHFWQKSIALFERVKTKDVVILSRQLSTLFEAKVPVLDSFKLLANESESDVLRQKLAQLVDDIQGGISMSQAMSKHPDVFSQFYVSMVRSGEESGKLDEVFTYLADHLERSYELSSKARNALIYPAFVIFVFIVVITLMLVFVIPKMSAILIEAGQEIPLYTRIIVGIANFLITFGPLILIGIAAGIIFLWRYVKTQSGRLTVARIKIDSPYIGSLYKKLYLSRITDNLKTLISSGVAMVRSLEVTTDVINNEVYKGILEETTKDIKGGQSLSDALAKHKDVPQLVPRMIKIGEETGKLDFMLSTLARFYKREVENAIDTLVSLIEPAMIVILGVAIGFLLISILGPIYNMTAAI